MSGRGFTFIQVTDLHLSLGPSAYGEGQGDATIWVDADGMHERVITTPQVLADLFVELAQQDVDFVVATGDLTNEGTPEQLEAWAAACAASPVRIISVPGNHDHEHGSIPSPHYERIVGDRYFSFDHDGVHFAAIDWWSWRMVPAERELQERWLHDDLNALPAGTPVVMLTHDQMDSAFYDALPVRPVASFSGHWHTTRAVEHHGTVHYNTANATFGGLDYSPACYRLLSWTGERLDARTIVRGPSTVVGATMRTPFRHAPLDLAKTLPSARWGWTTRGGSHLSAPVVVGDDVLVVSRNEDVPGGSLEVRRLSDGGARCTVMLDSAIKAEPVVVDGAAVVQSVSGQVVCVDLATGATRWSRQVDDPLRPWAFLRPATDGQRVYVGDVGRFVALDLQTGDEVWSRSDLGQRENLTSFTHPVIAGGSLVVGFPGQQPPLWGLDPVTGETRWPLGRSGRSIYQGPSEEIPIHLPQVVVSGLSTDPDGEDLYLVRLGATVQRLRGESGEVVWSSPGSGWFNPAAPVVAGDALLVTESTGRLHCYDRASGERRWISTVSTDSLIAAGSYRADGAVTLAPATVVGDLALLPTGEGTIAAIAIAVGSVLGSHDVGAPVTGRLVVAEEHGLLLACTVDGGVIALELEQVLKV